MLPFSPVPLLPPLLLLLQLLLDLIPTLILLLLHEFQHLFLPLLISLSPHCFIFRWIPIILQVPLLLISFPFL